MIFQQEENTDTQAQGAPEKCFHFLLRIASPRVRINDAIRRYSAGPSGITSRYAATPTPFTPASELGCQIAILAHR